MNHSKKNVEPFVGVGAKLVKKEIQDYQSFAFGENMIAIVIALVLASIVQKFANTISESILMPIISYMNQAGGNWRNLIWVPVEGMNLEIGKLGGVFIEFVISTIILYIVFSKILKRIHPDMEIKPDLNN